MSNNFSTTDIENYLDRMKYRSYSTGVMHISPPQWMMDIRTLMAMCKQLNEFKKHCERVHSLPDVCCPSEVIIHE